MASDFQAYASIGKDVVVALCSLTGAYVALSGLKAWKRQLLGKTDYELARRFLLSAYKVRDAVKVVRDPYISPLEATECFKGKETAGNTCYDLEIEVCRDRLEKLANVWTEYEVVLLEAEVSWGDGIRGSSKNLKKCVSTLRSKFRDHIFYARRVKEESKGRGGDLMKVDEVIQDAGNEDAPDKFQSSVNDAISEIADFLSPHLKA